MAHRPTLNADILHHLFTHFLTGRERGVCAQVCRAWEEVATPIQWRSPTLSVSNIEDIADILGVLPISAPRKGASTSRPGSRNCGVSRSRGMGIRDPTERARYIVTLVRRLTLTVEYTGPEWGAWRDEAACWTMFCRRLEVMVQCLGTVRDAGLLEHVHLIFNIHLGHLTHTAPMVNQLSTLLGSLFTHHLALRSRPISQFSTHHPRPLTLHLTYNLPTAPVLHPHIHTLSTTSSPHAAHLHALTIHGDWATEADLVAVLSSAMPPPSHRRGSEFELNLVGCVVGDAVWEAVVSGFNEGRFARNAAMMDIGGIAPVVEGGRRGRRNRRRNRTRSATPLGDGNADMPSSPSFTSNVTAAPPSQPPSPTSSTTRQPPTRRLRLLTIASSALSNPLHATRAIEVLAACANLVKCLATPPTPRTPGGGSCVGFSAWRDVDVGVEGVAF